MRQPAIYERFVTVAREAAELKMNISSRAKLMTYRRLSLGK
jgi:hypothetical protein